MFTIKNDFEESPEIYQMPLFDPGEYSEIGSEGKQLFLFDPDLITKPEKSPKKEEDPEQRYAERLKNAYEKCRHLCSEAGIPFRNVVAMNINSRLKANCGRCIKISEEYYAIEIAQWMLEDCIPEHELMDTILHELCHTVKHCMNHQKPWKEMVRKLEPYGYRLKRLADFDRPSVLDSEIETE